MTKCSKPPRQYNVINAINIAIFILKWSYDYYMDGILKLIFAIIERERGWVPLYIQIFVTTITRLGYGLLKLLASLSGNSHIILIISA